MDFITPVLFCKPIHLDPLQHNFKTSVALRDFDLDNIAAIMSTAAKLDASGSITPQMKEEWRKDHEFHGSNLARARSNPRPLTNVAIVFEETRALVGHSFEGASASHKNVYSHLLCATRSQADHFLSDRLVAKGYSWSSMRRNLRRVPTAVPHAHDRGKSGPSLVPGGVSRCVAAHCIPAKAHYIR